MLGHAARGLGGLLLVALVALPVACEGPASRIDLVPELGPAEVALALTLSPLPPMPPDPTNRVADDPRAARFGQVLFFDRRLSGNGEVACATCHDPARGLANGAPFGQGVGATARHVPAIWNTGWQRWFTWDGRADTAWAQALGPLEAPNEQGGSRVQYAQVIARHADLRSAYEETFGPLPDMSDPARFPPEGRPDRYERWHPHVAPWKAMAPEDQAAVTEVFVNLGKALAAYERRLVSRDAPFDDFVRGLRDGDAANLAALDAPARRGLALFVGKALCRNCHHGPLLSDGEFHDLHLAPPEGAPRDTGRFRGVELLRMSEFNAASAWSDAPDGERAARTGFAAQPPQSWGQFKTPSLRNVALTAPYMHDGRFQTLEDVLHYYVTMEDAEPPTQHTEKSLVPVDLSLQEQQDLIAFLESLTGAPIKEELLRPIAR